GIHELGGLTMLILHPQYTGRPSRLRMLQELVDEMKSTEGVWITHGVELARYALSEAAGIGVDGRPPVDTSERRALTKRHFRTSSPTPLIQRSATCVHPA